MPGADGASITRIGSDNSGAFDAAPDDGGDFVVVGQFGILTINTNGDYSYLRSGIPGGANPEGVDVFTYTLTDGDGDQVTTTLTIAINNFAAADNIDVAAKVSYICGDDTTWQVANASAFTEGRSAEGQRSISAANTNTALIAALAAAGVAAAAAAKDPAPAGDLRRGGGFRGGIGRASFGRWR